MTRLSGLTRADAARQVRRLLGPIYGLLWILLLWLLLGLFLLADWYPNQGRAELGAVSTRDIRAAGRVSFVSEIQTQQARERAAASITPILTSPDRSLAIRQTGTARAVAAYLDSVRSDTLASDEARLAAVAALEPVRFDPSVAALLLALDEEAWERVVGETLTLIDQQMRAEIRESRLPTLLRTLDNQISVELTTEEAQVVSALAGELIIPNTFLDVEKTEQARAAAIGGVAPIEVTFEPGQIIVREGDIVTAEQIEALQAVGLQQPGLTQPFVAGALLFLLLLVSLLALYLQRVHTEQWESPRAMALITILLAAGALGTRILIPQHVLLSYLFPTTTAAMLLTVLLGVDIAIVFTTVLALIVGMFTGSIELAAYILLGGAVAALMLWRIERLGTFVWTGVVLGLTNVAVVIAFDLLAGPLDWVDLGVVSAMAMLNGAFSASLALAGFYALSGLLGITTFVQLMELARPTNPLFRELLLKAPGTYHHSIVISNLAERAAEQIGADMLLVRVGAYYHDIGKTEAPHFFVENQSDGINLHDELNDPYRSAEIILGHVHQGVRLAQKHKLPAIVVDFIRQHHGTTSVQWFHHQACLQEGEENVDRARFRYPGPKPQSREAAILMMADSVEAKARAVKPATTGEMDQLIRSIFVLKLGEGQLDECDLSLRDIDQIRQAFLEVLLGIYHPRMEYPADRVVAATPRGELPDSHAAAPEETSERGESSNPPDRSAVEIAG